MHVRGITTTRIHLSLALIALVAGLLSGTDFGVAMAGIVLAVTALRALTRHHLEAPTPVDRVTTLPAA